MLADAKSLTERLAARFPQLEQRARGSDWVGLPAADDVLAAELLAEAIEANRG